MCSKASLHTILGITAGELIFDFFPDVSRLVFFCSMYTLGGIFGIGLEIWLTMDYEFMTTGTIWFGIIGYWMGWIRVRNELDMGMALDGKGLGILGGRFFFSFFSLYFGGEITLSIP